MRKYIPLASTVLVFLALYSIGCLRYDKFSRAQVFVNFLSGDAVLGIIAVGMTFVILSGGIDLSVGSVMALSSILLAVLMASPPPLQVRDLQDPATLVRKLHEGSDPLSRRLRKKLRVRRRGRPTVDVRALVEAYDPAAPPSRELQEAVAEALSQLIASGDCLHSRRGFKHVALSDATRALLDEEPVGKDLVRLNRLLLEEAYPGLLRHRSVVEPRVPPGWAIPLVLLMGTAFGVLMGCVIWAFRLAPFIVTLAGMFFARGLAQIIHIEPLSISNAFYRAAGEWALELGPARLSVPALLFLAVVAVGVYVATYTAFGRNVYALGGNEEAALLMGIPVARVKIGVYAFSGFCSALAGVVFSFGGSGNPSTGVGMELDAIAAVVVGGTLLSGGVGYVFGTLIGVLIFGVIRAGINFEGDLNSWWTKVVIGVLLLFFIVLQKLFARPAARPS